MTEDDPTDEISDLEARIEALAEIAERCRKIILGSKIAIACGFALLLIALLGLLGAGEGAALGRLRWCSAASFRSGRMSARCGKRWPPSTLPRRSVRT
jgi:hypothetical protein